MTDRGPLASVVLVLGIIVLIASVSADWLGLGERAGFGPAQLAGLAVGVALMLVGVVLLRRRAGG